MSSASCLSLPLVRRRRRTETFLRNIRLQRHKLPRGKIVSRSSVLNEVARQRRLRHTSNTPRRTRDNVRRTAALVGSRRRLTTTDDEDTRLTTAWETRQDRTGTQPTSTPSPPPRRRREETLSETDARMSRKTHRNELEPLSYLVVYNEDVSNR